MNIMKFNRPLNLIDKMYEIKLILFIGLNRTLKLKTIEAMITDNMISSYSARHLQG